jgi:hypothetical protein
VVQITNTIKILILEFVSENGSGHIQEIHLKVSEIRPEIPQHTIRARLSEMSRSKNLEDKIQAFGNGFYGVYAENKYMTSVVSFPDRGPWGDARYRGNCSGYLVKDLILRFNCQSVFDPAEGGKTVRDVVTGINKFRRRNIYYEGRDLSRDWDIVTCLMPEKKFDMVWFHPPYWDIIKYSDNPSDLSNCKTLDDFEQKLNRSVERLLDVIKPGGIIAILIGDKRKSGQYFALLRTLLMNTNIGQLKSIIIKLQHNCQSDNKCYNHNPFLIPIKHEYCLIYQKTENACSNQ